MFVESMDKEEYGYILSIINVDPLRSKIKFEEYLKRYPKHYSAYPTYISNLIILGKLEEAERVLNYFEKLYKSDESYVQKKYFVELLERDIFRVKLKLLAYKEKYEEMYDVYRKSRHKFGDETMNIARFYCQKMIGKNSFVQNDDPYIFKQIACYKHSAFKDHIQKHLMSSSEDYGQDGESVFAYGFPIDKVINEVKRKIPSDKKFFFGFYEDVYIFKYDRCGVCNGKVINYFKVVCFHNTKNIITMFPTDQYYDIPYTDLNYMVKKDANSFNKQIEKRVSIGDLVLVDGEKYLVKKIVGEKKFSLLKVVHPRDSELAFSFNGKQFNLKKDVVVFDGVIDSIVEKYGNKIIEKVEEAKRKKQVKIKQNQKVVEYKIGDIFLIDGEEKFVIDIVDDWLILVDEKNKCSRVLKNGKYKIVGSLSKEQVKFTCGIIEYDDNKRDLLLSSSKFKR